ncbi:MAG: FAD-binding oxidoreductase [Alphaproteobacteria bacterium]|nr:FAD-binding oxidoreductase [Alphaproteobacteria bacterium]
MSGIAMRWDGWGHEGARVELSDTDPTWSWLASELGIASLPFTPSKERSEVSIERSRLPAADRDRFAAIVGDRNLSDADEDRLRHALGRSYPDLLRIRAGKIDCAPDLVLFPGGTEEVVAILALASECDCAVTPFGGGTSVVGGITANRGTHKAQIVVDLGRMNRLIDVDSHARLARAQAGIPGPDLECQLGRNGLTLGHLPQSFEFSTLGGWIAHRGAGQASNAYGRPEDWLAGATLATPRGLLSIKPMPASSSGPDLTGLVVGSEGTFGIITEAAIRVHAIPDLQFYSGYLFRSFESGAETIRRAVQQGIGAAMLRLSDAYETRFYRNYGVAGRRRGTQRLASLYLGARGFGDAASAMVVGFEGDRAQVQQSRRQFARLAKEAGAMSLGEEPGRRWKDGRFHAPYLRDVLMARGVGVDTFETATGWSNLATLHDAVRDALAAASSISPSSRGIVMCHISHSYPDGASLYFTCIFVRREDELEQWQAMKTRVTDAMLANGGTLSHHHGVGSDHLAWMREEKGDLGLDILRAIKAQLDPASIMNPGKLVG